MNMLISGGRVIDPSLATYRETDAQLTHGEDHLLNGGSHVRGRDLPPA